METEPHPIIFLTLCIYLFISATPISKQLVKRKIVREFRVEKAGFKQGSSPSAAVNEGTITAPTWITPLQGYLLCAPQRNGMYECEPWDKRLVIVLCGGCM